jgi:hypothetical protein
LTRLIVALLGCLGPISACAQAPATITFSFNNPGLDPPAYTLVIQANGSGFYRQPGQSGAAQIDAPITIDSGLREQLFAAARHSHFFAVECQMKHSHVAFTGQKTFAYNGPEGSGSCTFNYARDQQLDQLGEQLEAVVTTLGDGEHLAVLLAHDKLGLDAAVEQLAAAQTAGQALDLGNIAPVLRAIAADDGVLDHTRVLARSLLPK